MALEAANVEQLMEWFADGSPVRSQHLEADVLVEKLAALVFDGERDWPDRADRVDVYRDGLRDRFDGDSAGESEFCASTLPDADPAVFIAWFVRVIDEWEAEAASAEEEEAEEEAEEDDVVRGYPNPNHDGTPGTAFYRTDDEDPDTYLYADAADGPDWLTYEERRYTEPDWDEGYRLNRRYDRLLTRYEWQDAVSGEWHDQTWADRQAEPAEEVQEPIWDAQWQMFYRVLRDQTYEYAEAVTPKDQSSGCSDTWVNQDAVLLRDAKAEVADAMLAAAQDALQQAPELAGLDEDDIRAVLHEIVTEMIAE
ncbi:hypothetical protein [Streptacidiphilus anmyonensis]|uniref:hypothetical protein n=1 Tax=Streptacidiphilus anmyonensis TaxID=405782 RepID=UPI0005A7D91D|nr:hypothetical protein [Streptacidiphilus anmyonensis]